MTTPNLPNNDRDLEVLRSRALAHWVPLASCDPAVLDDVTDMVSQARERGLLRS